MEEQLKRPPTVEYVGAKKGVGGHALIDSFLKGCAFGVCFSTVIFIVFGG